MTSAAAMAPRVSKAEATAAFARIGLLSFGGPAAQISVMHRILVDEKKWLSEPQFLHALNFCMLLPGPEAMQLATYAGWLMHGVRGGLIAGLLFVVPGLVMMLALGAIFVGFGEVPAIAGLLYGLKAAVLAVVAAALINVSRRALKTSALVAVAVAAFIAIAILDVPFPFIVIGAGLTGTVMWRASPRLVGHTGRIDPLPRTVRIRHRETFLTLAVWSTIWAVPFVAAFVIFGRGHFVADAAVFFSKAALVTFGGAYAVLAYVAQQAVEFYGWLRPDEMLTGLGLAETTLGPLVLVLVFVGFVGGAGGMGLPPMAGGLAGGLIAAFFTFVPCFLWIFVGAPYVEALRNVRWLSAALSAITAAVVGVIANLAVWFGMHVLFGDYPEVRLGPLHLPAPDLGVFDAYALAIAVCAAVALIRFKVSMMVVLGVAAVAGLAVNGLA